MALNNSAYITAEKVMKVMFNEAVANYSNANAWDFLNSLAFEAPSNGAEEDYRWLQELPEFQEWLGDLTSSDLADYVFTIRNKEFAASVPIRKTDLDDDKMDTVKPRIQAMAGGESRKWGKLIDTLIQAGTTALAFDGIAFFSAATGVRLNNNLLTGTVSAATPTLAQVAADIRTVRAAMLKFVDSRGEIVGIVPDTFVVPPNLEFMFLQFQNSMTDPTGANPNTINPYRGFIKNLIVDPGLTDLNDFYAFATTYGAGAIVKQRRSPLELFLDDTQVLVNRKLIFGGSFRGNVGFGLPILACKVVSGVA